MTTKGVPIWGRLFLSYMLFSLQAMSATNPQLNIIVVMGDDHGQWAMGTYGDQNIETPNLDWLAEQGVLFENAISPAPVCSPARASFHTGKLPSQHGVHDFLAENIDFDSNWLEGETLLSERLSNLGYRNGLFGKWHATTNSKIPQRGFDRWLSYDPYRSGWENQYNHSGRVTFSDDGDELDFSGTQAWYLTSEAIRFIDEDSEKPFFISLNFTEPHFPFEGLPERLVKKYRLVANKIVSAGGNSDFVSRGAHTRTPLEHIEQLSQYLAAVNLIDEQMGRIIDALSGRGILDNTLLVYTADHGLLVGQYGLYGKTNATAIPNFYDETIKIPLIISGPNAMVRGSQRRDEFVDLIDLHTTILDYASNGSLSISSYGPGVSLRPLLYGERETNWRIYQTAERGQARMIMDGRWKLVRMYQREFNKLPVDYWFDLSHPFGEKHSIKWVPESHKKVLIDYLEDYFSNYEDPQKSGRKIWHQPMPNPRMLEDLLAN